MTFEEGLMLVVMGFCTGFGLEFSKWFFEKVRKVEGKIKLNGKEKK